MQEKSTLDRLSDKVEEVANRYQELQNEVTNLRNDNNNKQAEIERLEKISL